MNLFKLAELYFIKCASVTFFTDIPDAGLPVMEPCLCTQMHEKFNDWYRYGPGPEDEMKAAASPDCYMCKGSGVEGYHRSTKPELNFSNDNASAVLGALGLPTNELYGEMSVHEAKRALIRAKNRSSLDQFTRAPINERNPGRARIFDGGISEEGILERLERFEKFLENSIADGATKIHWE